MRFKRSPSIKSSEEKVGCITGTIPKIPQCDHCLLNSHNPHIVCVVHPAGPQGDSCLDFREDPNAEPLELWEPEGATYYNGELILQPKQRWTREQHLLSPI